MSIRLQFQRLVSHYLGLGNAAMAMPVLAGPARGLWFRTEGMTSESKDTSKNFVTSQRTETLSHIIQRGWTVWDCSGEAGVSTVVFSKFVGTEGLVVAFEPDRKNFMQTYDNATLNGCNNIFFLFAAIGEPTPRKSFLPPVCARQFSLDEGYQDGEIPIPQLIRLDLMGSSESALLHCRQLVSEQRPLVVIDRYSKDTVRMIEQFAGEYRYQVESLESGKVLSQSNDYHGSILLRPTEKG